MNFSSKTSLNVFVVTLILTLQVDMARALVYFHFNNAMVMDQYEVIEVAELRIWFALNSF